MPKPTPPGQRQRQRNPAATSSALAPGLPERLSRHSRDQYDLTNDDTGGDSDSNDAIPLRTMAARRAKSKNSDSEDPRDPYAARGRAAATGSSRKRGAISLGRHRSYVALTGDDMDNDDKDDDSDLPGLRVGENGGNRELRDGQARNRLSPASHRGSDTYIDIPDPTPAAPDQVTSGATRSVVFGPHAPPPRRRFAVNAIRNNKYNPFTFFPLVLYEQFKFFFNLYFLLVALSQFVPALRIGYLVTYVGPLCFVLMITIGKEGYDDWTRRKRDEQANAQRYEVIQPDGPPQFTPSAKLKVGDLIILHKNDRVPADCVLLKTTEASGACFIRTDQLDGETDWKLRVAVAACQKLPDPQAFANVAGTAEVEAPHKDIYSFLGTLQLDGVDSAVEPLSVDNTLWTNTVLASGTAVGLVVFTGKDTRAVMNTNFPTTKVGLLDLELNRISKVLCLFTALLSLAMIAMTGFQGPFYVYFCRFLILFSSIIPISLRVNLDMGKTYYARQIQRDARIPGTVVRTSTIPEELGRLEYFLSDKTGTLTQNDMELRKLHMGTMSYGLDTMDEVTKCLATYYEGVRQRTLAAATEGHVGSDSLLPDFDGVRPAATATTTTAAMRPLATTAATEFTGRRDISARVGEIVQALALCHNVTPTSDDDDGAGEPGGVVTYQASSPDEIAIVNWTESVGLVLVRRDREAIRLRVTAPDLVEGSSYADYSVASSSRRSSINAASDTGSRAFHLDFDILYVFPFTSESKRMGIVVRERATGEVTFYQKGADTVMARIIQYNDWLDEECGNMAREGLRTLVIAKKRLSEQTFAQFDTRYQAAGANIHGRQAALDRVVAEFLEHDLELLGLTGVEDKLQEDVKGTLELLRNAGLKVWMLTGDKVETATCIAVSSKLVARNQPIHQVARLTSAAQLPSELDTLRMLPDCCLVIDGQSLQLALDYWVDEFIELAMTLPAVVCCRCSPTQKAAVARLIKERSGKRVCAIGDGGNDVSMILAADVGIGIEGKEGKQASLAADFSITQFSHVARLLLWHGRNSYKRSAKLSQFVIHRGLIISVMQAVFSAMFYYAPIALYQGALMVGYSTVYTMAPVFSLVLDRDVTADTAMFYPELYKELTKGRSLSFKTFFWWLLISVYQAGTIMMLAIWLFDTEFIHIVSISFTALIFNELLMVAFEINTWHRYMIYSEVGSLLIYLLSIYFLKSDFDLVFMLTWNFAWKLAVIILASTFSLYVVKLIKRRYAPPSYAKLV
ncbi:putative aminophospholipid-translocase [Tieghemiomyces parasiticus]|uniref:Phospholipid-transporting ATPase n=1 Tax=Tieghemiomyces parasiticus TaxID=78921 RepID=A0A9W8DYF8_9FUNG|nr:putative aminophospholipid-translocase [Tieghemiomyces parasiticus]